MRAPRSPARALAEEAAEAVRLDADVVMALAEVVSAVADLFIAAVADLFIASMALPAGDKRTGTPVAPGSATWN